MATEKPKGWEYLLFFQAWIDGVARRTDDIKENRTGEYNSGAELDTTRVVSAADFAEWSAARMGELENLASSANALLNTSAQEAFGNPGEPGDAEAIVDVARKLGTVLDGVLRWGKDARCARLAEPFERMGSELARFPSDMIDQFERFPVESLHKCEQALAQLAAGNTVSLHVTMTFRLSNVEGYQKQVEAARRRYKTR